MNETKTPHPTVTVDRYQTRAFAEYAKDREPYEMEDSLSQKLWSVVAYEFGPGAADVLVAKLQRAVEHHITKTGRV